MTHRLTDEMINEIKSDVFSQAPKLLTPGIAPSVWSSDCMRAAYDKGAEDGAEDTLEQVFEWIRENLSDDYYGLVNGDEVLSDLKQAMRPQEDTP